MAYMLNVVKDIEWCRLKKVEFFFKLAFEVIKPFNLWIFT